MIIYTQEQGGCIYPVSNEAGGLQADFGGLEVFFATYSYDVDALLTNKGILPETV